MFETTGVDGVMIGRAALHNPFIFRDIHAYVNGELHIENEIERRIDAMQRYLVEDRRRAADRQVEAPQSAHRDRLVLERHPARQRHPHRVAGHHGRGGRAAAAG